MRVHSIRSVEAREAEAGGESARYRHGFLPGRRLLECDGRRARYAQRHTQLSVTPPDQIQAFKSARMLSTLICGVQALGLAVPNLLAHFEEIIE
jgi:hypothetical protein